MTLITSQRLRLARAAAVLLIAICAGAGACFSQSPAAQTKSEKQETGKDLSCTYYDKGVGHPGVCGIDKQDKTYRCYSKEDPSRSNPQIACEGKIRRASGEKK